VKGPTHLQRNHSFGSASLAALARASNTRGIAGDDRLIRRVQVSRHSDSVGAGGLVTGGLDLLSGQAEHGGHGPGTLLAGREHKLAPPAHQPGGVHGGQRARRDVGTVLAQAVSRCGRGRAKSLSDDSQYRSGMSQNRRLGIVREGEVILGTLPHQP